MHEIYGMMCMKQMSNISMIILHACSILRLKSEHSYIFHPSCSCQYNYFKFLVPPTIMSEFSILNKETIGCFEVNSFLCFAICMKWDKNSLLL